VGLRVSADYFFSHLSYSPQLSSSGMQVMDHGPRAGMTPELCGSHVRVVGSSSSSTCPISFSTYIKNRSEMLEYAGTGDNHATFFQLSCVQTQYYCP